LPLIAVRWHTVPREMLMLRELEDGLVVRNAMTGSTHLLEPLAAEVLGLLLSAEEGMTAAELAARIGDEAELQGWTTSMEELLLEFKRLGLAGPVD